MSVLQEIVARKRVDVAARQHEIPWESLCRQSKPTQRSLLDSLRKPGLRFILECKKASPSEGLLRPNFDPTAIAAIYRDFADGISVLTDGPFFAGELAHLKAVRAQVAQPILCKDFVVDPYQIWEARVAGADAILLMLSVLGDDEYRRCAAEAARLNMDILTEVHDEAELGRALSLDARMIGINNRDLNTLKIDLGTTRRLAPQIPSNRLVICESGIRSRADLDALDDCVDAFLVGSQLMKAPRLDLALRELIHGAVKICGLRSREQIRLAHAAGACYGGLVFASESLRFVNPDQARLFATDSPLPLVGVFVNESLDRIVNLATVLRLHAIQLHGDETAELVAALRKRVPDNCEIWKAVQVNDSIPSLAAYGADRLLLDACEDGQRGGTGKAFDWNLLSDYPDKSQLILAGGIRPDNVLAAHRLGCGILDVSSGVESAAGVKDELLLRQLFAALRGT